MIIVLKMTTVLWLVTGYTSMYVMGLPLHITKRAIYFQLLSKKKSLFLEVWLVLIPVCVLLCSSAGSYKTKKCTWQAVHEVV
jgi:hypothetical protein